MWCNEYESETGYGHLTYKGLHLATSVTEHIDDRMRGHQPTVWAMNDLGAYVVINHQEAYECDGSEMSQIVG